MLEQTAITCPWCWQTFELSVDCSAGSDVYVEDCVVCCRAMSVRVHVGVHGALLGTEVAREGD